MRFLSGIQSGMLHMRLVSFFQELSELSLVLSHSHAADGGRGDEDQKAGKKTSLKCKMKLRMMHVYESSFLFAIWNLGIYSGLYSLSTWSSTNDNASEWKENETAAKPPQQSERRMHLIIKIRGKIILVLHELHIFSRARSLVPVLRWNRYSSSSSSRRRTTG